MRERSGSGTIYGDPSSGEEEDEEEGEELVSVEELPGPVPSTGGPTVQLIREDGSEVQVESAGPDTAIVRVQPGDPQVEPSFQ
jgi:hypothetical protein